MAAKQAKLRAEQAVKNKLDGEAFLAANKNNPGVVVLPDGLQYKVLTDGTGAMPAADATVTVNYRGTLLDGTEFDSSDKRASPREFPANQRDSRLDRGAHENDGRLEMEVVHPVDLAYGEQGNRGIPPNSVLIFEVELLDTKAPPPPPPGRARSPATSSRCRPPRR